MSIFIFHGIEGSSKENWFPWLALKLRECGREVLCLDFPSTNTPHLEEWFSYFEKFRDKLTEDATVIGHSMGAAFALNVLQKTQQKIRALYLIAPVWTVMGNEFDPRMTEFVRGPFAWEKLRELGGKISVFASDNDPYIRLNLSKELAENLGAECRIFSHAGHFNTSAGYTEFPELLQELLSNL